MEFTVVYDWILSGKTEQCWSRVLSIGRLHPHNAKEVATENDQLFIVIPGNPGHCQFYETFATHLQAQKRTVSVWVISHVGHVFVPPELQCDGRQLAVFDGNFLARQTRHKAEFISQHVPKILKLSLIGHSIGSYMIVEMLDELATEGYKLKRAWLLFPTLERMTETPNGKAMCRMRRWRLDLALFALPYLVSTLLSDAIKHRLIGWRCGRHKSSAMAEADKPLIRAAVDLLNPTVTSQALKMAYDEFEHVQQPNLNAIIRYCDKLNVIYAQVDGWCPLTFRDQLLQKVPNLHTTVCENDQIEHAFVIFDSVTVADMIKQQYEN